MDRLSSSTSTASSIDDYSEHNMWNPLLELLFLGHVNGIVDANLVDLGLAKIAFSCHFALDLLCYKEDHGIPSLMWHHCLLCHIDVLQNKAGFRIRLPAVRSVYVAGRWFPSY